MTKGSCSVKTLSGGTMKCVLLVTSVDQRLNGTVSECSSSSLPLPLPLLHLLIQGISVCVCVCVCGDFHLVEVLGILQAWSSVAHFLSSSSWPI